MKADRIHLLPSDTRNINIYLAYEAERAAWVTHPDAGNRDDLLMEFVNEFEVDSDCEIEIHVTADQRYELSLDGEFFAAGPDRCDLDHWSFSSWKIALDKGKHVFRCLQWYFGVTNSPSAQITLKPGFLFATSDKAYWDKLNTGSPGVWKVALLQGLRFDAELPGFITRTPILNVRKYLEAQPYVDPVVTENGKGSTVWGAMARGWRLYPSELPEQFRAERMEKVGKVCAVYEPGEDILKEHPITREDMESPCCKEWQAMIDGIKPVTVAPNTNVKVLVDLEDYYCGYTCIEASGGDREHICIRWAESLYKPGTGHKGNRSEILGKTMQSRTDSDRFEDLPPEGALCRHFWWRSGRYMELTVCAGDAPVTVKRFGFRETRYPLEDHGEICFGNPRLDEPVKIYRRVMQMCSHETFMDCPYYEQLMYVGDSRMEALTFYMMDPGHALPLRSNLLFSWSRNSSWEGLVGEHYPSHTPQLSSTFSMIWPGMVLDLLKYRRIPQHQAVRLRNSARGVVDAICEYLNGDDLLEHLPGWSFEDWVVGWTIGISKAETLEQALGYNGAVRCMFNLHCLMMLKFVMELEDFEGGSALRKAYMQELYDRVKAAVMKNFWDEERAAFRNDLEGLNDYCEHTISLAIIAGILTPEQQERAFHTLITDPDLYRTTIYFKFYLFEAFRMMGRADLIANYMDIWNDSLAQGAVTTWEAPGDTRSDCHAWGAHPYYHYYSSIAGIRPASFGFRTVSIEPQMGELPTVKGRMPHPDGYITFDFRNGAECFSGEVTLPAGVTGSFRLKGEEIALHEGLNAIKVK